MAILSNACAADLVIASGPLAAVEPGHDAPPRRARRRQAPSRRTGRRTWGAITLAAALTLPTLAFGGQHVPVLIVAAVLSVASMLLLSVERTAPPPIAWGLLALALYTVLQVVPLPMRVVEILSPAAASIWSGALHPFREPAPHFVSLSVAPAATLLEVIKWSTYACLAIAVGAVRSLRGAAFVATIIFGSACLVCGVTLLHGILDAHKIYGLYAVNDLGERWTRGPLTNGNNLAGYLNLGIFTGAGLWFSDRLGRFRWLAVLGAVVLSAGVLLTGSRGGVLTLGLGAFVFAALALRQQRMRGPLLVGGLLLVMALAVGALASLGDERLIRNLTDTGIRAKAVVWLWATRLFGDFPVFGVGRGGFETAFPPSRGALVREWSRIYTHAENFPVDWLAEWGIPIGLAALVGLGLLLRRLPARALEDPLAAGMVVAVGTLLVQNLADLGLEIFGVTAAGVAGLVVAGAPARAAPSVWSLRLQKAAVALTVLGTVSALLFGAAPAQGERHRLKAALSRLGKPDGPTPVSFRAELHSAMLRYPGDAYFPLLGALAARLGADDAMPWLDRALERDPRYGQVHLALADTIHARKRTGQALMHLRLAAHHDLTLDEAVIARALTWTTTMEALARGHPEGAEGSELLGAICERIDTARQIPCWREVSRREPKSSSAAANLVEALLDALEAGRSPCDSERAATCRAEAEQAVKSVKEADIGWRATYVRARLLAFAGNPVQAATSLVEGCPSTDAAQACLSLGVGIAARARDVPLLKRASERYLTLHCPARQSCAAAHDRVAALFAEVDAWPVALEHYGAAAREDGTPGRWLKLGEIAAQNGAPTVARTALRRAEQVGATNAELVEQATRIEKLLREP